MKIERTGVLMARVCVVAAGLAALILVACDDGLFVLPPPANPFNPPPQANPLIADAGENLFATEDETLTLTATASGGDPPYFFRWNIERVPDDPADPFDGDIPDIPDNTQAEIQTVPFQVGQYVYRVLVTDSTGDMDEDFVTIDVGPVPFPVSIQEASEDGEPLAAVAAEPFTLTAATDVEGDLAFLWTQVSGPDVTFADKDAQVTEVTVSQPGQVVIRLTATNRDDNLSGTAEITVDVEQGDAFLVLVDQPDLILLDETATLTANISNDTIDADTLSYQWEITNDANAELSATDSRTIQVTGRSLETIALRVTASGTIDGTVRENAMEVDVVVLPDLLPEFTMTVASDNDAVNGDITFQFDADATPKTTAHIVSHIDQGFYTNVIWHRIAFTLSRPFVAQFGGFTRDGEVLAEKESTRPPAESENATSIGNELGTIGLALRGGDAGSGTTQIFVNTDDNRFLDNQRFTAFGRVIDGMELIDAMFEVETGDAETDQGNTLSDVPVSDIIIVSFRRKNGSN
ncbi:MAG: peptidylprolyl isomerase [Phycisphaerae bacterium]